LLETNLRIDYRSQEEYFLLGEYIFNIGWGVVVDLAKVEPFNES